MYDTKVWKIHHQLLITLREEILMATKSKKTENVNEEVKTDAVEEKKPVKRSTRKKKTDIADTAVETVAEKVVETKEAVETPKAEPEKKEEEKKPAAKRSSTSKKKPAEPVEEKTEKKEEKKEEKKPAAKRSSSTRKKKTEPKKEITTEPERKLFVQYNRQEIEEKEIVQRVEEAWRAEGNTAAIESIIMYVKPEDGKVYYVVNGLSGSIDLF